MQKYHNVLKESTFAMVCKISAWNLKQPLPSLRRRRNLTPVCGAGYHVQDHWPFIISHSLLITIPSYRYSAGQVKLSVLKGDITDQRVDVIVNAANDRLAHGAGVAGAIVTKGGSSIQKESDNFIKLHGSLRDGEVAVTGPGRLPCKKIIHAVGPMWNIGEKKSKRLLKMACQESLVTAGNSNFKSIAFPAISSGIYGMPRDVCAKVMFAAVKEYVMQRDPRNQTLTDIRFVIIDDPTVNAFKKEFTNFFQLEIEKSFADAVKARE